MRTFDKIIIFIVCLIYSTKNEWKIIKNQTFLVPAHVFAYTCTKDATLYGNITWSDNTNYDLRAFYKGCNIINNAYPFIMVETTTPKIEKFSSKSLYNVNCYFKVIPWWSIFDGTKIISNYTFFATDTITNSVINETFTVYGMFQLKHSIVIPHNGKTTRAMFSYFTTIIPFSKLFIRISGTEFD
jgi:hypothetical protein